VLVLQDLRQHVDHQILAATMAAAMGAEVEMPDWAKIRTEFDQELVREPERDTTDPDRLVMMRALGLRD